MTQQCISSRLKICVAQTPRTMADRTQLEESSIRRGLFESSMVNLRSIMALSISLYRLTNQLHVDGGKMGSGVGAQRSPIWPSDYRRSLQYGMNKDFLYLPLRNSNEFHKTQPISYTLSYDFNTKTRQSRTPIRFRSRQSLSR